MVILTAVVLLLTLLGFFTDVDSIVRVQRTLVNWAVIIAAFALILGFFNVFSFHMGKLSSRAPGWPYSLVLILSAAAVLGPGLGELYSSPDEGLWGPFMSSVFVWIIAPLQAATAALLPFILTYAAYRMLRLGSQGGVFVFLISALVVLISRVPLPGLGVGLRDLREVWLSWLAIPGLRAVLIGVALGIAMTALRLIMGVDRPQG